MAESTKQGGKKNRKFGRNKEYCLRYKNEGTALKNKKRRMARHLREKRHANDSANRDRLANL
jgi:hypothetical protein